MAEERRVQKRIKIVKGGGGFEVEGLDPSEFIEEEELADGDIMFKIRVPKSGSRAGAALGSAAGVSGAIGDLQSKLGELVRQARADGYTWTQIGAALGISKQAAWERFSGEE